MSVNYINNTVTQAMSTNEFWNNFPVSTPYMSQTAIKGQEQTLLDTAKYAIDIDNNLKTRMIKGFPVMSIMEKVSQGATTDKIVHTWTDRIETDGNTIFAPVDTLRQRDYLGTNSGGTARGTGVTTDIMSALGSKFEIGGKLMFQHAYVSAAGGGLTETGIQAIDTIHGSTVSDTATITIGSSALQEASTDKDVAGIAGEMKETGLVKIDGKLCMVLGFSRSSDYLIHRPDDMVQSLTKTFLNAGYEMKKLYGAGSQGGAITWNDAGPIGNLSPSASSSTYSIKYVEGTSKMCHWSWDMLYTKYGYTMEGLVNKIVGIRQFIFAADLRRFVLVFDFSNSNIDFLEEPTEMNGSGTLVTGAKYLVTKGTVLTKTPGNIVTGDNTSLTSGNNVVTIPKGFLLEEVNTSYNGDGRFFEPGKGKPGEGWTRLGKRICLNFNTDMDNGASATGSFNLDDVLGGYHRTEQRGKNYLQIYRSKVWGQTRLAQGTTIRGGSQYEQDKAKHLASFYAGINWSLLMGKLQFSQNVSGNVPSTVFGYNSSAGLHGEYNGKVSGLLDYATFPIVWARQPFYMGRPGYNAISVADQGFALVEYLEKLAKSLGYKRDFGTKAVYTAVVSSRVVEILGLAYAKNAAIVSDTGNPFGTSIRYNSPDKVNMNFETFTYIASDGTQLNFVVDRSLDMAPKFKCPRFLLGKEYVNPRYLIVLLNKQDVTVYKHKTYPDQIFTNLQPNHNVNITLEGAQGSRTLEVRNPEEQMIVDISPTSMT